MWKLLTSCLLSAFLMITATVAQNNSATNASGILTIDSERLFLETKLGQTIQSKLDAERASLLAENQKLDQELTVEEAELARKRTLMPVEEFRLLADAFNEKVENIRESQDAKQQELSARYESERQKFFNLILPIMSDVVEERSGVVVFERRQVFLSAEGVDITNAIIERVNEVSDELVKALNQSATPNEELNSEQEN